MATRVTPKLSVADLVELGDIDELIRRVDDLCDAADWDGIVDLRRRCRAALERGRQLWPVASHAEYRIALQAPGSTAATVIEPSAGRFALGPLTEVVASTHSWEELAPRLPPSPEAALVAHERVVRGEDLAGVELAGPPVLDLPLALEPWEPTYPVATYKPYTAEFPDVPAPPLTEIAATATGAPAFADPVANDALVELVTPWTSQSNGRVRVAAVTGDPAAAVASLGGTRMVEVDPAHALALMAWAAASGGAHGRRRGMAYGRFGAWWAVAALAGTLDDWPHLDEAIGRLRWYRWDHASAATAGWSLRLAAERVGDGVAWAVEAVDGD